MLSCITVLEGGVRMDFRFSLFQRLKRPLATNGCIEPFVGWGPLKLHLASFTINLSPLDAPPTSHVYYAMAEMSVILLERDLKPVDSRARVRYEATGG